MGKRGNMNSNHGKNNLTQQRLRDSVLEALLDIDERQEANPEENSGEVESVSIYDEDGMGIILAKSGAYIECPHINCRKGWGSNAWLCATKNYLKCPEYQEAQKEHRINPGVRKILHVLSKLDMRYITLVRAMN
jgi:hypothetical protein